MVIFFKDRHLLRNRRIVYQRELQNVIPGFWKPNIASTFTTSRRLNHRR